MVTEPPAEFALPSIDHLFWHRIRSSKGDEGGNAGLEPVRQVPRGYVDVGFAIENTEYDGVIHHLFPFYRMWMKK
jgi:hypothetical protein